MAKGDSLKKYKIEQKAETRKNLEKVIEELKLSKEKISVAKVAVLSGMSRASIYANYKDLIDSFSTTNVKVNIQQNTDAVKEKNKLIEKLREENKHLRDANSKLMDQLVAMKILYENK